MGQQMINTLQDILGSILKEKFLAEVCGERCLFIPGSPQKFADIAGWRGLNELLNYRQLNMSQLQVTRELRPITPDAFMNSALTGVSVAGLTACLRGGARLAVDHVDLLSESIGQIAKALEGELRTVVAIGLYAETGTRVCRDPRYDTHETLILQVDGKMSWCLQEQIDTCPIERGDFTPSHAPPLWEGTLDDGDALYIPRGCTYSSAPQGTPSLHLSIRFGTPTGIDILHWLTDEAKGVQAFRASIPRYKGTPAQDAYLADLRVALEALLVDPELIARFLERSTAPTRLPFHLPISAMDDALHTTRDIDIQVANATGLRYRWSEGREVILVAGAEKSFLCLDPSAEPLISYLNTHLRVSLRQLIDGFDDAFDERQIRELVQYLVDSGLLVTKSSVHEDDMALRAF